MKNSQDPNCLFCKIISGEVPSQKVFEDEHSYAFLDINPTNFGHTLLIPKDHHENIYEIPNELMAKLAVNMKTLSSAIKEATDADGINIGMNNGSAAWQIIFHAHIHIIPRFKDDGFAPWGIEKAYKAGEEKTTAEKIMHELSKKEDPHTQK